MNGKDRRRSARRFVLSDAVIVLAFANVRRSAGERDLRFVRSTLDLTPHTLAPIFHVSRAAIENWIKRGVPSERGAEIGRIADVARRLARTFKAERIPAIVRASNPGLGGRCVLDVLASDGAATVMAALDRLESYVPR